MPHSIDLTDVRAIDKRDLALALRLLLAGGRMLASAHSLTEDEVRRVEQAFWQRAPKSTSQATKVAVLVRLRSLVSIFSTRRMQVLLARYGADLVPPALAIASTMRLNATWGFSPQKFALALESELEPEVQAMAA